MWFNLFLVTILAICVFTDLKSQKIYNKIIFPSLGIAFISHLLLGGFKDLSSSLIGFSVGFSILLIPYFLGGFGAGDVKLLALIGAIKGSTFVVYTSIYMAIIGGIIAFILLIRSKRFLSFIKSIPFLLFRLENGVSITEEGSILTSTYPYGVAIAMGAVFSILLEGRVVLW